MGISFPPIRDFVVKYIIDNIHPQLILDVGCGFGYYGRDLKKLDSAIQLVGIEIFEPYLNNEKSWTGNYDTIFREDLRYRLLHLYYDQYDLVLLMDVIEHFEKEEALSILNTLKNFNKIIISTPLFNYKQGIENNNEMEAHKCWFLEKELNKLGYKTLTKIKFPSRSGDIGAFIRC